MRTKRYLVDAYDEDAEGDFVFYSDFEKAQEELGKLDAEIIFLKNRISEIRTLISKGKVLSKNLSIKERVRLSELLQ